MERQGAELVAQDGDALEAEPTFPLFGRRKKRARFDRQPESIFILKDPFLQDAFQGNRRIDDVHLRIGCPLDCEFGHGFPVLEQSVVDDGPGDDECVLVFRSLEREVAELDLDLLRIRDRGVGGDKRSISGCR